ncbi:hypothetical protein GCM10010439_72640 [Actinocorallia aurantiaca]|uniref:PatA-like N-terminal domain-containing protein n=1 Tax=Actinocorallia aurantiaca TaxID=46204 RepID=A0ABP6H973_9ACTN
MQVSSIIDELDVLTRDGASGALKVEGRRRGTVYLDDGRFIFAEAAGVPDLASRLIGARRLTAEQWNTLRTEGRPGEFGSLLVERGIIGEEDLTDVLHSAFLDAVTALTADGGEPETRFAPLERPWIGSPLGLEVGSLKEEVSRLAEHDFPLDAKPRLSDLDSPWGVVERREWAVACRMDGATTLRDLAWHNGFSLYETFESVQGLIRAGLCTLSVSAEPEPAALEPADETPLPRREPGSTIWDRTPVETGLKRRIPDGNTMFAVPNTDLMKRLIQALQDMD